jgi:hypothetical protein
MQQQLQQLQRAAACCCPRRCRLPSFPLRLPSPAPPAPAPSQSSLSPPLFLHQLLCPPPAHAWRAALWRGRSPRPQPRWGPMWGVSPTGAAPARRTARPTPPPPALPRRARAVRRPLPRQPAGRPVRRACGLRVRLARSRAREISCVRLPRARACVGACVLSRVWVALASLGLASSVCSRARRKQGESKAKAGSSRLTRTAWVQFSPFSDAFYLLC